MHNNILGLLWTQKACKFLSGRCVPTHLLRGHSQAAALTAQNLDQVNPLPFSLLLLDQGSTSLVMYKAIANTLHSMEGTQKIPESHYHEGSQPRGPAQANGIFSSPLKSRGKESLTEMRSIPEKKKQMKTQDFLMGRTKPTNAYWMPSLITAFYRKRKGMKCVRCSPHL